MKDILEIEEIPVIFVVTEMKKIQESGQIQGIDVTPEKGKISVEEEGPMMVDSPENVEGQEMEGHLKRAIIHPGITLAKDRLLLQVQTLRTAPVK